MSRTGLAFVALVFGAMAIAGDPPSPPALSKVMPADDLIAQVEVFHKSLHEMSADEPTWQDNSHKVTRDAQTLAAVALMLGLYDSDHALKTAAPALVDAAQALGEAKDYATAQKALLAVDAALKDNPAAAQPLRPRPVGSMGQLMKQAGFANSRIQRGLRRITDRTDEKARDAAVLAALGQATMYDTYGLKRDDQLDRWYQLCGQMRDRAGQLNAAIRAADKVGAEQALKELEKSCSACHTAFRTTK
jgi:hypothetical protein